LNIAGPEGMQQSLMAMGRSLHQGAALSGQQSALAVDTAYRVAETAVQVATDIAIEVATGGAATPAVAAKWMATLFSWASKVASAGMRVVRAVVSLVRLVGAKLLELGAAAVRLGQRVVQGIGRLMAGAYKVAGQVLTKLRNVAVDVAGWVK